LTINVGDTVQWLNDNGFHNVNATTNTITGESYDNPESFTSSPVSGPILLTRKFTIAGTYEYDCSVGQHAANGMVGNIIVNTSVSINELNMNNISSFNLYLTNSQSINVIFGYNKKPSIGTLNMYDFTGQLVNSQEIEVITGSNKHHLVLESNTPSGIYIISFQLEGQTITKKIIIQ